MNRKITAGFLAAALALLAVAALQNRALLRQRAEADGGGQRLENAPPLLAFTTIALGGFRGILADILWLRATYLQEKGNYFELVQLADWIAKLEPRNAEVWAFHAWNMAYNLSASMPRPEDRWRWIENAIRLLRDEGLAWNPRDPRLYFELGWLFQHKIAGFTDEANVFYKTRWMIDMQQLFGSGRPDYAALSLQGSPLARRLREEYRLDPAIMQQVDEEFGPLDWRLPQTHAVYWGSRGLRLGRGPDALRCERLVFQSMSALFRAGRIVLHPDTRTFEGKPVPELLDRVCRAYESAAERYPGDDTIRAAYANFLKRAAQLLHREGLDAKAGEAFARLTQNYPGDPDAAGGFDALMADGGPEQ